VAPVAGQGVGRIAFSRYTLTNGLEVILAPDRSTQVVGVSVWYDAGSRLEPVAKAGLARLFERLMFAGSANVPPGGHATLTGDLGGRVSAIVDEESARFTTVLPSSRLALGLWLEANRMGSLSINDTTVGEARLELVEQLRDQLDREPYAAVIASAVASVYDTLTCPGYAHPPLGRLQSITGITTTEAQEFFRAHYAPNRARLTLTGEFDTTQARQLIAEYFGPLPRGADIPPFACAESPPPAARTIRVTDRSAPAIAVGLFFPIPPHAHRDTPALELLEVLMSQGGASRLNTALVREALAALGTQGGVLGQRRGPGAFGLFAIAAKGVPADSLAALLQAQARWAAGDGLTEAELTRARRIYRATAVSGRERPGDIAGALQHAAMFHADPEAVNTEVERVLAVTLADLRRAAATWLNPAAGLTLIVLPADAR
jgi:zinc protease